MGTLNLLKTLFVDSIFSLIVDLPISDDVSFIIHFRTFLILLHVNIIGPIFYARWGGAFRKNMAKYCNDGLTNNR